MIEPHFPSGADIRIVLAVFLVLLIGFDIILVRWLRLGKVAWKKVEYVWLGFGALGLFGAASQVRISVAIGQTTMFQEKASTSFLPLRQLTGLLSSSPGPICRTFVRSEASPPPDIFDRVQKEYDEACDWIKPVASRIPEQVATPLPLLQPGTLASRPETSIGDLKDIIDGFYRQLGYYNSNVETLDNLLSQAQRNQIEDALVFRGVRFFSRSPLLCESRRSLVSLSLSSDQY